MTLPRVAIRSDLGVVAILIATLALMVVPLPTEIVDVLLALNMGVSVLLLMTAFYLRTPVQFSTLPSVILMATVFRLSLSIAVTRLVLVQADAGSIIRTFGDFVVAGNILVGLVIFMIITVVQFIVITKGAERIAEVAARFTLDALPGKQMAIDADLRSGELDQAAARARRRDLERESQLYGAMDGAMKFVKGDAIAGLVIITVNLLGGLAIGTTQHGMSFGQAGHTYSILTVGDGLVAQIPALLVSITAGIVVTRVAGGDSDSLGGEVAMQLGHDSRALWLAAIVAVMLGLIPGFPILIFMALAVALGLLARAASRRARAAAVPPPAPSVPLPPARVQLVLSPALAQRVDAAYLSAAMAHQNAALSRELGAPVPHSEVIEAALLEPQHWRIDLDGVPIGQGSIPAGMMLLRDEADNARLAGVTAQPGPSLPGESETLWVPIDSKPALQQARVGFRDVADTLAGLVPVTLRQHAAQFVGIQEARQILASAEQPFAELVREVQRVVPLQRTADLFRRLLDEGISLRNMRGVLECMLEHGGREQDPALLTEAVRSSLRRQICHAHADHLRVIAAFIVDSQAEGVLRGAIQTRGNTTFLALAEGTASALIQRIKAEVAVSRGPGPVILTAGDVRRHLRGLLANNGIATPVMGFHDLLPEFTVQAIGTIRLTGTGDVAVEPAPARQPLLAAAE